MWTLWIFCRGKVKGKRRRNMKRDKKGKKYKNKTDKKNYCFWFRQFQFFMWKLFNIAMNGTMFPFFSMLFSNLFRWQCKSYYLSWPRIVKNNRVYFPGLMKLFLNVSPTQTFSIRKSKHNYNKSHLQLHERTHKARVTLNLVTVSSSSFSANNKCKNWRKRICSRFTYSIVSYSSRNQ